MPKPHCFDKLPKKYLNILIQMSKDLSIPAKTITAIILQAVLQVAHLLEIEVAKAPTPICCVPQPKRKAVVA